MIVEGRIEVLREEMQKLISKKGTSHIDTIIKSQELDKEILKLYS